MSRKVGCFNLNSKTPFILEALRYPLPPVIVAKIFNFKHQYAYELIKKFSIPCWHKPFSPQKSATKLTKLWERFIRNVYMTKNCWFWIGPTYGGREGSRYGHLGHRMYAHREALFFFLGVRVPKDAHIIHDCDTSLCVNPHHLRIGTAKENVADSISKGVCRGPHGYSSVVKA